MDLNLAKMLHEKWKDTIQVSLNNGNPRIHQWTLDVSTRVDMSGISAAGALHKSTPSLCLADVQVWFAEKPETSSAVLPPVPGK